MNADLMLQIITEMLEFQKLNNITTKCVTNVQFLYDIIKPTFSNVKVVPVIAISTDQDLINIIDGHLVLILEYENKVLLIEPSYEIKIKPNLHYAYNIKDFIKYITNFNKHAVAVKRNINNFLEFQQIANKMNNNMFCVDKIFYNNQANYLEKKLNIQFVNSKKID